MNDIHQQWESTIAAINELVENRFPKSTGRIRYKTIHGYVKTSSDLLVVHGKETECINRLLILVMISYGHYTETSKTKASRPKENIESNIF